MIRRTSFSTTVPKIPNDMPNTLAPEASLLDPYKVWLQLTAEQRPLNAYQLLGLQLFEPSRLRIDAALNRQLSKLEIKKSDADPKLWAQIRKEVESAGALLIDPQQKTILDASLRRQMATGGFFLSGSSSNDDTQRADPEPRREGGVKCHHCEKMNLPDRKFCAGCGQAMWEPCPNCSALGPGGEKFCGKCGTDIPKFVNDRCKEYFKKLEHAKRLQGDNQFESAKATLHEVAKVDDPRFDKFARQAAKCIEDFALDRRQREGAALVAFEKAQKYFDAFAFDRAIKKLERVPERLQSKAAVTLLADARARWNDVMTLNRDIRTALEANRTLEILPKIERLLAIKPDHDQARQLGIQIGLKLCKGAQKLLAEQRHDETLKLLRQIPSFASSPEVDVLMDNAAEMAWMWNEVKSAPFASPQLMEIAERLLKVCPENEELKNIIEAIQKRIKAKSAQPWITSIPRATLPKNSQIGIPVSCLGGLRTIPFAAGVDSNLFLANPGRFLVACGLALQGIGKAAFPINLMPEGKKSMLAGIAAGFQRKKVESAAWGVDFGSSAIKLVKLSQDAKEENVRIEEYDVVEIPFTGGDSPDADLESSQAGEDALRALVEKHKIGKTDCVYVNLPGMRVLGRFFLTPPVEPKRLDALIQYEVGQQIPYSIEDLAWDYACVDKVDEKSKDPISRRVMIVASKLKHARARIAWFERAGLKVFGLQSECVALHNLIHYDHHRPNAATADADKDAAANSAVVVLDIGGETSNIVMSGPEVIWFRTIGVASFDFSRPLVRTFNLTREQVEELKRKPTKAKRMYKMYATLEPAFSQLTMDVHRSLETFAAAFPEVTARELWGMGGGFQMHGLLGHFWGTPSTTTFS